MTRRRSSAGVRSCSPDQPSARASAASSRTATALGKAGAKELLASDQTKINASEAATRISPGRSTVDGKAGWFGESG